MNQFDTHTVIKELVQAGMPEPQAEIIVFNQARLVDERLATKQDIEALRLGTKKDIESLRAETQQSFVAVHKDIEMLRAETKQSLVAVHKDIEMLRAETKKDIESLKGDIKKDMQLQSSQLIIRMGGMLVMAVGLLGGLQIFVG